MNPLSLAVQGLLKGPRSIVFHGFVLDKPDVVVPGKPVKTAINPRRSNKWEMNPFAYRPR